MIEALKVSSRTTVDDVVRRLVSARHFTGGSVISMPVTYPSGSSVNVEVTIQNGRCFVSDMGGAYNEAEMLGASRYFRNEATRVAEFCGIRFDGRDMFVAEVPVDNVRGAIVTVSNASAEAIIASAYKHAERNNVDAKDELYERLASIYRGKEIEKDAKLIGSSNHQWRISILVRDKAYQWMFEPVTGNYITVVGTTAKFHDFARMENAPYCVAVVKSQADLGDYWGLITAASSKVLAMSEPDSAFKKLLAAA